MSIDLKPDHTAVALAAAALTAAGGWFASAFSAGRKYQHVLDKLDSMDQKLTLITGQQGKEIAEAKASAREAHKRIDKMTGT